MSKILYEDEYVIISINNAMVQHIENGTFQTQFMTNCFLKYLDCRIRTEKNRMEMACFKDVEVEVSVIFQFTIFRTEDNRYDVGRIKRLDFEINSFGSVPRWFDMARSEDNFERIYTAAVNDIERDEHYLDSLLIDKIEIEYK